MTEIRNIILIGRTGSGKSSLANVMVNKNDNFEEVFEEKGKSISVTKEIKEEIFEVFINRDGSKKITYRAIDTIGIGDTTLTPQGVLMSLATIAGRVKKEGLNQILFATRGRFSKEEIEAYDLLSSVIFDKDVLKYTTIVRTGFPEFEEDKICNEDKKALKEENADLAHIIRSVEIIYLDNPPINIAGSGKRIKDQITLNKEAREESRKRLLIYLATCEGNYRPSNIDELDERVRDYMTNEEKLQKKMEELEKKRVEETEKYQTTSKMRDEHKKDMDDLKRTNKEEIKDLKDTHRQVTQQIIETSEKQIKLIQEQNKLDREANEKLLKEYQGKNSSSEDKITSALERLNSNDKSNDNDGKLAVRIKELENIDNNAQRTHEARMQELKNQQNQQQISPQVASKKEEGTGFIETVAAGATTGAIGGSGVPGLGTAAGAVVGGIAGAFGWGDAFLAINSVDVISTPEQKKQAEEIMILCKEQVRGDGYCDPNNPASESELEARMDKIKGWNENKEYRNKLYSCMELEDSNYVRQTYDFLTKVKEILGDENFDNKNDLGNFGFAYEDL
ncbi:5340_t:CDS:2, partial [Ambispora gerdemannii]